ncbi:type II secretion system F family protein [Cypionkella sp.]|uniref:type II secretion system F family protein n=1 Tax=Cypionkella sp. TaxID=2811411 RepID=UPI002AB9765F|nr:type II secretion system F family protein [Cypionkella sp.]MDZ4393709.1 type II secretion system F family protein [Cypionkella sp.]
MDLTALLSIFIALGVGLVALGVALIPISSAYARRAHMLERLAGASTGSAGERGPTARLRRDEMGPRWPWSYFAMAPKNLAAFGAELRRASFLAIIAITALVSIGLRMTIHVNIVLGALIGIFLTLGGWYLWMRWRNARRLAAIDDSVPEAIDMIVRSLRVGLPIGSALQTVSRDLTGPIAKEFAETADHISYGKDLVTALQELAERTANQSMRFFAAAVAIQYSAGGNLAEVLERLAAIARGRQQMRRKVKAITAEAKWSGRFLSAFPVVATMALLAINPDYFLEIQGKPFFKPMLAGVAALLFVNVWFMHKMTKME